MPPSPALTTFFQRYSAHHLNPINKAIHWVCVPLILFSLLGLIWLIPVPRFLQMGGYFNWATLVMAVVVYYWYRLSPILAYTMIFVFFMMGYPILGINTRMADQPMHAWMIYLVIFIVAWAGQFIGHKIEGKKPSFLEDLRFLLIGPLWLLHFLFRRFHLPY